MQTARAGALVIVPLAAFGTPSTGVVLPDTNTSCVAVAPDESVNCLGGISVSTLPGILLSGIQFTSVSGGGPSVETSGGNAVFTIATGGTLTGGSLSGSIPVSFSFMGQASGVGFTLSAPWTVEFELGSSAGATNFGSLTFSGAISSSTTVSGSGSAGLPVDGPVTSGSTIYESIVVTLPTTAYATVDISFPFSFEPEDTPEPASVGMLGSGLGFLGWLLRRRRVKKS
jgi:hypothetical protein